MTEFDVQSDEVHEGGDSSAPLNEPTSRRYEDLSLAEFLGQLVRNPARALSGLSGALERPPEPPSPPVADLGDLVRRDLTFGGRVQRRAALTWEDLRPAAMLAGAFLLALVGSQIMVSARGEDQNFALALGGIPLLIGAAILASFALRDLDLERIPPLKKDLVDEATPQPVAQDTAARAYPSRLVLGGLAALWALGSWVFNANNQFTTLGVVCWIMSIVTLIAALADRDSWERLRSAVRRVGDALRRPLTIRVSWTLAALVTIMLLGAWFRFSNVSAYPPDMTSDHVEKLLDAVKVYEGERPIFFPNNGGRESFQMYYLAALKDVLGVPFSFDLLKIGTGIEGMVMILLAYWMGRAVFGDENRELGNLTGLIMAALIAISFWHTLLSRLGLRIVTTTLVAAVVFIYLVRAMRYNRRADYLIAGFALGASMYFYQAARMLPLMVIAGLVIAILMRGRSRVNARSYVLNFVALVLVSLAVFLPLGRYMTEHPSEFWERTAGRLFGDAYVTNPDGSTTAIPISNRIAAFVANMPELANDFVKSALMFNWKGDRAWFSGAPDGTPALDFLTGALFIVGLGIVVVRIWRRRDPVEVLLPISILIMILPSALAIAFPIEVPSFTRGSGALPMVYLVAALGLATVIQMARQRVPQGWPRRLSWIALVALLLLATLSNSNSYFVDAMADYRSSTLPHKQAGQILAGFSASTGAPGNAFMIAYKYWMDHRAIGIEAGEIHWANGIADPTQMPEVMFDQMRINEITRYDGVARYAFNPNRQMLFFLNSADSVGLATVQKLFPKGLIMPIQAYDVTRDFEIYVVSPPGCDWARQNLGINPAACTNVAIGPDTAAPDTASTPTPAGTTQ